MLATILGSEQKTLMVQFNETLKRAEWGNSLLQKVKGVCKPVYSVLAFWKWGSSNRKDCFGYNIPDLDPNRVLKDKLGSSNVKEALTGVIQLLDPEEDVSKLELNGKFISILSLYSNQFNPIFDKNVA